MSTRSELHDAITEALVDTGYSHLADRILSDPRVLPLIEEREPFVGECSPVLPSSGTALPNETQAEGVANADRPGNATKANEGERWSGLRRRLGADFPCPNAGVEGAYERYQRELDAWASYIAQLETRAALPAPLIEGVGSEERVRLAHDLETDAAVMQKVSEKGRLLSVMESSIITTEMRRAAYLLRAGPTMAKEPDDDSPNHLDPAIKALRARNFQRVNDPRAEANEPGGGASEGTLASIRRAHEELPKAAWFKGTYEGKSIGDAPQEEPRCMGSQEIGPCGHPRHNPVTGRHDLPEPRQQAWERVSRALTDMQDSEPLAPAAVMRTIRDAIIVQERLLEERLTRRMERLAARAPSGKEGA